MRKTEATLPVWNDPFFKTCHPFRKAALRVSKRQVLHSFSWSQSAEAAHSFWTMSWCVASMDTAVKAYASHRTRPPSCHPADAVDSKTEAPQATKSASAAPST